MPDALNVLDLFSGIGGFSLGLERAGFRTIAFCEFKPYRRAVLARHWPGVPIFPDVTRLDLQALANPARYACPEQQAGGTEWQRIGPGGQRVDVICGGFPCQDISLAGKGAGIEGERSGLWREYRRLIRELRPGWVVIENVSALLTRGVDVVLGDLAALGYDAEWHCIPAAYVGAPHRRDRIWIVAYPHGDALRLEPGRRGWEDGACAPQSAEHGGARHVDDTAGARCQGRECQEGGEVRHETRGQEPGRRCDGMADAKSSRRAEDGGEPAPADGGAGGQRPGDALGERAVLADTDDGGREGLRIEECGGEPGACGDQPDGCGEGGRWDGQAVSEWWEFEPDVGRVVDGVSTLMDSLGGIPIESAPRQAEGAKVAAGRVHRLEALGDAVVPQIVEMIGHAIQAAR